MPARRASLGARSSSASARWRRRATVTAKAGSRCCTPAGIVTVRCSSLQLSRPRPPLAATLSLKAECVCSIHQARLRSVRSSHLTTPYYHLARELIAHILTVLEFFTMIMQDIEQPTTVDSNWSEVTAIGFQVPGSLSVITDGELQYSDGMSAIGLSAISKSQLASQAHVHMVEISGTVTVGGLIVHRRGLFTTGKHCVAHISTTSRPRSLRPYNSWALRSGTSSPFSAVRTIGLPTTTVATIHDASVSLSPVPGCYTDA